MTFYKSCAQSDQLNALQKPSATVIPNRRYHCHIWRYS